MPCKLSPLHVEPAVSCSHSICMKGVGQASRRAKVYLRALPCPARRPIRTVLLRRPVLQAHAMRAEIVGGRPRTLVDAIFSTALRAARWKLDFETHRRHPRPERDPHVRNRHPMHSSLRLRVPRVFDVPPAGGTTEIERRRIAGSMSLPIPLTAPRARPTPRWP